MKLTNSFSGRGGCMVGKKRGSLVCITTETFSPYLNVSPSSFVHSEKIKAFRKTFLRGGDGKHFSANRFFWNVV